MATSQVCALDSDMAIASTEPGRLNMDRALTLPNY
jgi:hypothetical protein